MKLKYTLALAAAATFALPAFSQSVEQITIKDKTYDARLMLKRDIGPGTTYMRYRMPDFPLNFNLMIVDLNNEYNTVENMQGGEQLCKTELLESAAARYTTNEKRVVGGANANFWIVTGQRPWEDLILGAQLGGSVRNGEIITETTNTWDVWWWETPAIAAIDSKKTAVIDRMRWEGHIINEKIGSPEFFQCNKVVHPDEITLYNHFFGRDKQFQPVDVYDDSGVAHWRVVEGQCTEVYLNLDEGEQWMAGRPMKCTVMDVKTDAGTGTLGDYDLAIVGRGFNKDNLAKLVPGDKVTVDHGWTSYADGSRPELVELVAGNTILMRDGVLEDYNYTDDYNKMVYSRTAYGSSADGKTLYIITIDKVPDPRWGTSIGVTTEEECYIMKHFGCVNLTGFDGGGSAQMLIEGKVINKTTESYPRAVANGMMVYDTAPADDVITRIEFDDVDITVPNLSTSSPRILGYNKYGSLIDHDVKDIVFTCEEAIGTCDGNRYTAGDHAATGKLTATLGNASVSKDITVVEAQLGLRLKPVLIDSRRSYPVEMTATSENGIFNIDPATVDWTIEDPAIATIGADGVLKGLKNGSTTLTGTIGRFTDRTTVTVEIPDDITMTAPSWEQWTAKGASGISGTTLSADGTISFNFGSPRDPAITLTKDFNFYSLPDKITLSFTSSAVISSITLDMRTRNHAKANQVIVKGPEEGDFAAGTENTIEFPISAAGDPLDMATYPLTVKTLKISLNKNVTVKGEHSIKLGDLTAHYNGAGAVDDIVLTDNQRLALSPNPVDPGATVTVGTADDEAEITVFDLSGAVVSASAGNSFTAPSAAGIYIVTVKDNSDIKTAKLIVR